MTAAAPPTAIFLRRVAASYIRHGSLHANADVKVRATQSVSYAQYALPAGALMTTFFSTPIAFFNPSSPDISESSCSMLMT